MIKTDEFSWELMRMMQKIIHWWKSVIFLFCMSNCQWNEQAKNANCKDKRQISEKCALIKSILRHEKSTKFDKLKTKISENICSNRFRWVLTLSIVFHNYPWEQRWMSRESVLRASTASNVVTKIQVAPKFSWLQTHKLSLRYLESLILAGWILNGT